MTGTKDEIYIKVKNYFTRLYVDANSVIQTDDKEQGTIIGKGLSKLSYNYDRLNKSGIYDTYHILRVDVKDNRLRVICSTDKFSTIKPDFFKGSIEAEYKFIDLTPFTKKSIFGTYTQDGIFIALIEAMNKSIDELEKAVKEGLILGENEDW